MAARGSTGQPTRRSVLVAALATGAAATGSSLGGCRLRLEDDAPSVPFLPRRSMPDEQLLVEQYRQVRALGVLAAAAPRAPLTESLVAAHERQAAALRTVLTDGGVPMSSVEAAPSPSLAASPSTGAASTAPKGPSAAKVDPLRALAEAESAAVSTESLRRLGQAGPWRSLLTAVATHRAGATTVLGVAIAWPSGSVLPAAVARAGREPAREAVYATEVAAARVSGAGRDRFLALLDRLRRRLAFLQAAAGERDGGSAPLGYRLPFPVTTAEDASRLVRTVLDGLVAHGLDGLAELPTGTDLAEVVRLHTEASVLRQQWGGPLAPFPGLAE